MRCRTSLAVFALAVLTACSAPASRREGAANATTDRSAPTSAKQEPPPRRIDDTRTAFIRLNALRREADREPNLLGKWETYRSARETSTEPLRGFIEQTMAALEAQLGLYDEALRDYPIARPTTHGEVAAFPEAGDYTAVPAADAIAGLARDRRIVFVNEAHHDAHTRELTLALLPRLRAQGFTHFAAETLDEKDRDLAARGYPVAHSGYYSDEPLYGEILRTALRLGYTVVPYESTSEGVDRDQREREQADNLYRRVFEQSPHARLLVHAGYAHVHKAKGYLWDTEPVAMQLAARLVAEHDVLRRDPRLLDMPLSIDQTVLRPNGPEREYGAYPLLLDAYAPHAPVVLLAKGDARLWSLEPAHYDVSVILPRGASRDGRPGWLDLGGVRRAIAIDLAICRDTAPCLLEARYATESADAVPADRWLRLPDAAPAPLYLFAGRYRLRALDAHGTLLGERELAVEPAMATDQQ